MRRFARSTAITVAAFSSVVCCAVSAAESRTPEQESIQPRFAVHAPRLQAAPTRNTIDDRFHLDARLQAASGEGQHGSGLTLQAKIVGATAASCAGADALFANGFE